MLNNKKVLAIITARGGSKGLPGKNIKMMCKKPLIAWTLEAALQSKYLDRVFVSTDSDEIAKVCKTIGVEVPELRPKELAQDSSSSIDVLLYTINMLADRGEQYDYMILLEPTSPLRKENDIDNIIEMAVNNPNADGVISVGKIHLEHPSIVKRVAPDGYLTPYIDNTPEFYQRQQEDLALFPYGVGYLVKVDEFIKNRKIYMGRILPYYIERWQCYEVDDIYDFNLIEMIMKERYEL